MVVIETEGRHFADDMFEAAFMNGNLLTSIRDSLKFAPNGLIYDKSALH